MRKIFTLVEVFSTPGVLIWKRVFSVPLSFYAVKAKIPYSLQGAYLAQDCLGLILNKTFIYSLFLCRKHNFRILTIMLGHNAACVRKSVSLSGSNRPNEPAAGLPSEFVDTQAGTAHLFAFKKGTVYGDAFLY